MLVVEDVVTTGGSTRETIEVARAAGRARSSARRRSSIAAAGTQGLDVPYHALATVALPTYQPEACPLCAAGQPVVKPGSRALRSEPAMAGSTCHASAMRTLKLTLAYDGTRFVGWQRQAEGESVQGLLEDALARFEGAPVTVHGAGRTDAGVHALGQVASVQRDVRPRRRRR